MSHQSGTIVVGVDGSPSSYLALDWAVEQAVLEGRELTLAHAAELAHPAMSMGAAYAPPEPRAELAEDGHRLLAQARSRIHATAPDLVVHDTLLLEHPRQLLLDLSEDAHLLVVGSRGRGPVTGLLLGSVGMTLVRHARCPVVVHRPRSGDAALPGVVVGVDGTGAAAPLLEFAYRQADLHGLPLTVLLSVWDVETSLAGSYLVADTSTSRDEERLQLSELMAGKGEDYPAVKTDVQIAHGLPFEMLIDVAAEMNLLVVGSRRGHLLAHLIAGSVSAAVVEHATCPVAVIPLHDQDREELR